MPARSAGAPGHQASGGLHGGSTAYAASINAANGRWQPTLDSPPVRASGGAGRSGSSGSRAAAATRCVEASVGRRRERRSHSSTRQPAGRSQPACRLLYQPGTPAARMAAAASTCAPAMAARPTSSAFERPRPMGRAPSGIVQLVMAALQHGQCSARRRRYCHDAGRVWSRQTGALDRRCSTRCSGRCLDGVLKRWAVSGGRKAGKRPHPGSSPCGIAWPELM